jgi:hypothetical protein
MALPPVPRVDPEATAVRPPSPRPPRPASAVLDRSRDAARATRDPTRDAGLAGTRHRRTLAVEHPRARQAGTIVGRRNTDASSAQRPRRSLDHAVSACHAVMPTTPRTPPPATPSPTTPPSRLRQWVISDEQARVISGKRRSRRRPQAHRALRRRRSRMRRSPRSSSRRIRSTSTTACSPNESPRMTA